MKKMVAVSSVLVLLAMSSAALAAPVQLTGTQLDTVTAGVSPWKQTVNPGGNPNGCQNNRNCQTIKNNPSANN